MNERLKILRKKLNLTQQEFANKIGSKRNTIAKYETCANTPSTAVVSLICKTFNVNEEWLRSGYGDMFNPSPPDELENLAKKYGLTSRDYIFIEKLMKNKELLSSFEDFCLDYANTLLEKTEQNHNRCKPSIDEQAEDYRRQLELEEKAAGELPVLRKDA